MCEHFNRAPKRRVSPEYYDVIAQPIDMSGIGLKIKNEEYIGVEHLSVDIQLLVNNAKTFYKVIDRFKYFFANEKLIVQFSTVENC